MQPPTAQGRVPGGWQASGRVAAARPGCGQPYRTSRDAPSSPTAIVGTSPPCPDRWKLVTSACRSTSVRLPPST